MLIGGGGGGAAKKKARSCRVGHKVIWSLQYAVLNKDFSLNSFPKWQCESIYLSLNSILLHNVQILPAQMLAVTLFSDLNAELAFTTDKPGTTLAAKLL